MSTLRIETAKVFAPLLAPSRYKGAYGGRGSGKSHVFAGLSVEEGIAIPGYRIMCGREIQKSTKESSKRLIEITIAKYNAGDYFEVLDKEIRTKTGGLYSFIGLQDHTAESIKSYEGYHRFWGEEDEAARNQQIVQFLKNTAMFGGLLMIIEHG